MASVLDAAIAAILGVVGILIFASVYAQINTAAIGTAATAILSLVTLVLAAVLLIRILIGGFVGGG